MNNITLCSAVSRCLPILSGARKPGKAINHLLVESFQKEVCDALNHVNNGYTWDIEVQAKGRLEKDSIDILGQAKGRQNWIIEIDATRSDQVSQKLLSRLALWGQKDPLQYVAVLYPDVHKKGQPACEKYLRYANGIIKKLNAHSSVSGIFVDPDKFDKGEGVELVLFDSKSNHFMVNGKECNSMNDAAAEAIRMYVALHPVTYAKLQKSWGKFVSTISGPSRYKNVGVKTIDGVCVYSYTQFRQYGLCSYWNDFERLCKKNGIKIAKMRKVFVPGTTKSPFAYI